MSQPFQGPLGILIIDDDPVQLEALRDLLESDGYVVETRENPLGTSMHVRRMRPRAMLLDVRMPALSGDRLARLLQQEPGVPRLSVILFSSLPQEELDRIAQQCGAAGAISKSTKPGDFLAALRRILERD